MELEPPDATLVRRIADGDASAFGALVRRHQAAVVAVAFAIVRDRDLALDLAQEAFVKAWRRTGDVRDPERVGAWLCGVVRFLARDVRRRERRRDALREGLDAATPAVTPLDRVIAREDERLVARVVEALPASYREPLLLHHVAGCSVSEIARTLALTEDAVKQRLSRGRVALRQALARADGTEPQFARAALALAPTATFTQAALDVAAATPQAPLGAGQESFMSSHPFLVIGLSTAAAAAVGLALATVLDDSPAAPSGAAFSPAPARAADEASAAPTTRAAPAATGTPPRRATDRAALLAAIRAARARAAEADVVREVAAVDDTTMTYDFAGETLSRAAAPPPPAPPPDSTALTKATLRRALTSLRPVVAACYEAALARTPDLAGTLAVRLVVEGEPGIGGVVAEVDLDSDATTIADAALTDCVLAAVVALELPAPDDGLRVVVHYPYTLSPG